MWKVTLQVWVLLVHLPTEYGYHAAFVTYNEAQCERLASKWTHQFPKDDAVCSMAQQLPADTQ